MKKILILFAASALLFSCKKNNDDSKAGVFKSADVALFQGKTWTSVKLNQEGNPEQLTVTIDSNALKSVPLGPDASTDEQENTFIVPLHNFAKATTPFQFIMLDWNPHGHEPAGIYDLPHFDVHFYMTSQDEVMNYTDQAKMDNMPAAAYLPPTYISPIPGVPMMGRHWIDFTSPELNGQLFTQTFIYGSYDGKVTFYEPMITLDFLKSQTNFSRSIPQPQKFAKEGWYPTKMRIVKHDGVTDIILDEFVKQIAS